MPLVELRNVGKSYGAGASRTEVLRDVDMEIEQGEFVAVVGHSGAGKTTLMSLVAGLLRPDTGVVKLNGSEVKGPGPDRGVIFQSNSLLPWLTVYENVYLAVDQVFSLWPAARKREHAERTIAMVKLTAARDKRPAQLSGGMRQRASVARALAMDPEVLLMDEPFGALDPLTRATLQDETARIWRATRKTVLLITSDVDEGILLADRILPLSKGPGATLGPGIVVDLDRPRDRKAINHDPRFKEIRGAVIGYLLGPGAEPGASTSASGAARASEAVA
ncbi:ABC transporter ATP-binding protein [Sorangium cellulosum]|uniref:Nitrate ABC transporter ATP-binding protein n=1 Tax=Sorangium cellulosum TaxID=56 RepID=A0A150QFP2_SORCE|nr:ABC transporter ATP-binding protein [Sorangium cellulosum]KYF66761.1 nitrate ABC transporter ATP-binding protein [Sorangium cellulosum]